MSAGRSLMKSIRSRFQYSKAKWIGEGVRDIWQYSNLECRLPETRSVDTKKVYTLALVVG